MRPRQAPSSVEHMARPHAVAARVSSSKLLAPARVSRTEACSTAAQRLFADSQFSAGESLPLHWRCRREHLRRTRSAAWQLGAGKLPRPQCARLRFEDSTLPSDLLRRGDNLGLPETRRPRVGRAIHQSLTPALSEADFPEPTVGRLRPQQARSAVARMARPHGVAARIGSSKLLAPARASRTEACFTAAQHPFADRSFQPARDARIRW